MKQKLTLTVIMVLLGASFSFCNGKPEKQQYVHEQPWFAFEYPQGFSEMPLQGESEVVRLAADNMYKLPVFIVHVVDKKEGFNQKSLQQDLIRRRTAMPGAYGFEVTKEETISLADGSKALFFKMKWGWTDGTNSIGMETSSVTALSGDAMITLTVTVVPGQKFSDEIAAFYKTLVVTH